MSSLQKINLLGSSFSLKVDEEPEYFKKVINHIEKMFSNIEIDMNIKDPLRIALLSCILLTDDLLKERDKASQNPDFKDADEVELMTLKIISLIDKTII
ncbi:MAG: cell division protein ZapA [Spirochaetales bacterium]|nr:cell division protein ZapA [Spirochaetales bacterium]